MLVFLFDITSSGVHHRICGTSVGRASLDICNLPPLPQLGERHECTVIFYRLLKIIFQYINSDIQLDIQIYTSLKTWDFVQKKTHTKVHFWLFLFAISVPMWWYCLCGDSCRSGQYRNSFVRFNSLHKLKWWWDDVAAPCKATDVEGVLALRTTGGAWQA